MNGWNRVLGDVRRDWGTDEARRVDWEAVDKRLFARIEHEHRAERRSILPVHGRTWKAMAAGLAAAAAVAIVAGSALDRRSVETERAGAIDEAASIAGIDGSGEVLVGGRPGSVGTPLRLGDVVEARGVQVTLGRAGKLIVVLERGSAVAVTHVQGALVLALARGAVEAQVVPIASGEALAIDVGPSRVAVHGTHFRVARTGEQVSVDLNEGVVSVGEAPRTGSTRGGLVIAPAHAEFFAGDAQGTLRVTHDPSSVRMGAILAPAAQLKPAAMAPAAGLTLPRSESNGETTTPPTVAGAVRPEPSHVTSVAPSASGGPATGPSAEALLTAAVRTCMADRLHADDVTVVVTTTLYLQLRDDGSVRSARFDPPVAPDVNSCAAQSIYKARFAHGGDMAIRVSVKT
jgi:hypothetical protein